MAIAPFIVSLTGSEESFRRSLAERLPEAVFVRGMSGRRVVVALPPGLVPQLAALPDVGSVAPDELRHLLGPGRSRLS